MDVTTLVIAVFGAVTGAASLAWSVASHVLSGGRVKVELRGGWAGPQGLITAPLTGAPVGTDPQLANEPVLAVRVSNSGRLPVSVEGWAVKIGGMELGHVPHVANTPVPKLLGVGESATWVVPVALILRTADAARETGLAYQELRGTVSLGGGKARSTKPAPVKTSELATVFRG